MAEAPFPMRQLIVLAACRICEPIAFMSIFPYVYYMVSSFRTTSDDRLTAAYAGMVTSAFAFAEFLTGLLWGRLSDRIGRKPILLTGLAGTGLSMILFGFAPSLPVALLARALGGLLNGNIGVLQTTVAEVVTEKAHQARAFSVMPFVWCLGSIVGSALGGTLAEPVKGFPTIFAHDGIFGRCPYLLPNLICTIIVFCSLVVGVLFLEETHEDKKHRKDYGLELGAWIEAQLRSKLSCLESAFSFCSEGASYRDRGPLDEGTPYHPVKQPDPSPNSGDESHTTSVRTPSLIEALNSQMVLKILGYGLLALHTISCEQLLPVLLSLPESRQPAKLPFLFTGGFALPTAKIGIILSVQGVLQMMAQLVIFPWAIKNFGTLRTFRAVILAYPVLYFLTPFVVLLPRYLLMPTVYFILMWKVIGQSLSYPSLMIMIANSAPSRRVLGTLNGAAASSASLSRALGPTAAGLIQTAGLHMGSVGLPWWTSSCVAVVGVVLSFYMKDDHHTAADDSCSSEEDMESFVSDARPASEKVALLHRTDS